MEFRFSEEEESFRKEVQAFIAREASDEVRGGMGLIDTPPRKAFVDKMAARGWLSRGFPEEYGGHGKAMPLAQYILNQELEKAGAPTAGKNLGVIVNVLLRHGNERLKRELVPRILRNEIQWALCYTEPEAGSDLANMQVKAVLDGEEYVINGQKRFITSAHFADYLWTGVRTDPQAPKHKGISLMVIDSKAPGITITPMYTVSGERTNEVFFDDVRVPRDHLVGELNRGWSYITEALDYERFTIISFTRVAQEFENFVEWLKQAEVDGKPLAQDPVIRRRVAEMAVRVEMGNMLEMLCVCLAVKPNYVPHIEAAMNKMWGGIVESELTDMALDIMGPHGYLWKGEPHAPMRGSMIDAYLLAGHARVAAAGVDIAKNIIARRRLGLPSGG